MSTDSAASGGSREQGAGHRSGPATGQDPALSLEGLPLGSDRTAALRLLREAGPVARDDHGAYVVTSQAACEEVLHNPGLFSSARAFDGVGSPVPMVPIAFDPPEHTRYRRILQPLLSPRALAPLAAEVRSLAAELIDGFAGRGECELVGELAIPLPAQVFLALFGLPLADRDKLLGWKDAILDTAGIRGAEAPSPESVRLGTELYGYLVHHIAERREGGGGPGLLGQLADGNGADQLSDAELLGLAFQFVLAGLDTVTCALSTAFAVLAARPRLQEDITADPGLIGEAVEELLRFDGPVVTVPRVATRDIELAGTPIPAGSQVQVAVAAANRDPAGRADPDMVGLRQGGRHLAFGVGPHRCAGLHLARMEMRAVLEEWHRRIPRYGLAPGFVPQVQWPAGLAGINHLPLAFPRGGTATAGS